MADSKISALTDGTTPASTDAAPFARAGGTTVKLTWAEMYAAMPGREIGYDQITSNVTVASTTEASGTTVISCAAHTFDGAPVMARFVCGEAQVGGAASATMVVCLFEGGTEIGQMTVFYVSNNTPTMIQNMAGEIRFTPSAGAHTYTVTAYKTTGTTAIVYAGAAGVSTLVPAFIRFTKV